MTIGVALLLLLLTVHADTSCALAAADTRVSKRLARADKQGQETYRYRAIREHSFVPSLLASTDWCIV